MTALDRQHVLQVGISCPRIVTALEARSERPQLFSLMDTAVARACQEVIYTGLCKDIASSPLIHAVRQATHPIMLTTLAAALLATRPRGSTIPTRTTTATCTWIVCELWIS